MRGMAGHGRTTSTKLWRCAAPLLALVSLSACSKESTPVAENPKLPADSQASSEADAPEKAEPSTEQKLGTQSEPKAPSGGPAAAELKSEVNEDTFQLKLQPTGAYKVGEEASVELVLDAKAPYKVNQEYPYSFALNESAGISFTSMKLKQDSVKLEDKRATMKVPFTPSEAGERTISGTFKFSVCTEEQCLIKKQDLALAVSVE